MAEEPIKVCKCAAGYYASQWKDDGAAEYSRHTMTYSTKDEVHQRLANNTLDWSYWQFECTADTAGCLIDAAPDLLAALKGYLDYCGDFKGTPMAQLNSKARAAIAKAEGK